MTLDLTQLILFGIICAATHWLIARSEVARPFWSRAAGIFARLLACAGCSGFWLGIYFGGFMIPVLTLPTPATGTETVLWWIARFLFPGMLGVFVTPVFEAVLLWGLHESAIAGDANDVGAIPQPAQHTGSGAHVTPVDNPFRKKTP